MTTKYCNNCKQNVHSEKHFSWFWFILFIPMTLGIGSGAYLIYHCLLKKPKCPMCHGSDFTVGREVGE